MGSSELVAGVRPGETFADLVRRSAQALADHAGDYVPDAPLTADDEQELRLVVSSRGPTRVEAEFTTLVTK